MLAPEKRQDDSDSDSESESDSDSARHAATTPRERFVRPPPPRAVSQWVENSKTRDAQRRVTFAPDPSSTILPLLTRLRDSHFFYPSRSERSLHTGRLQQPTAPCLPDHYELGDARGEHAARPAAPGEKHAVAVGLLRDQVEILVGTSLLYAAQHNANAFTLKIAAGNTNKIFSSARGDRCPRYHFYHPDPSSRGEASGLH